MCWPLVEATWQMPSSLLGWRLCHRAGPVMRPGAVPWRHQRAQSLSAPSFRVSSEKSSSLRDSCMWGKRTMAYTSISVDTVIFAHGYACACPLTWAPTSPSRRMYVLEPFAQRWKWNENSVQPERKTLRAEDVASSDGKRLRTQALAAR